MNFFSITFIIVLLTASCVQNKAMSILKNKPERLQVEEDKGNTTEQSNEMMVFESQKNDTLQKLEIQKEKEFIHFQVSVFVNDSILASVSGNAYLIKNEFGRESISDDSGNGYFVDQYNFKSNSCEFFILIDVANMECAQLLGGKKCKVLNTFMKRRE